MWYRHKRICEPFSRDNIICVLRGAVIAGFCTVFLYAIVSTDIQPTSSSSSPTDKASGRSLSERPERVIHSTSAHEIERASRRIASGEPPTKDVLDFSESDLRGAEARRAEFFLGNFDRANLSGADFTEAYLGKATINGAILRDATFRSAELRDASLLDADLSGANFKGAILVNAMLNGAVLARVNLAWSDLTIASAEYANLHRANLSNALLIGVNMRRAILSGANLSGARLHQADLRDADLHQTNLENADLRYAIVSRDQLAMACGNARTRLPASIAGFEMTPCS